MKEILTEIIQNKKAEIARRKKVYQPDIMNEVEKAVSGSNNKFKNRLKKKFKINCIGEIKKASPSKGIIRKNFNLLEIAYSYHQLDLAAISILTDKKYFHGDVNFLRNVKNITKIPLLRKDFIIDPYQIYEAKVYGADAVLLIVRILTVNQLKNYIRIAGELSMGCLVEVHARSEIDIALDSGAEIIGINNRDLDTFITDIKVSLELVDFIPDSCIRVSESAVHSRHDVEMIDQAGFDAVLIGEQFMSSDHIEKTYQELFL